MKQECQNIIPLIFNVSQSEFSIGYLSWNLNSILYNKILLIEKLMIVQMYYEAYSEKP